MSVATATRTDWSRSAAAELARACGGHPLALCLAGARLATRPEETLTSLVKGCPPDELLRTIRAAADN